jgi:hypothetical protein
MANDLIPYDPAIRVEDSQRAMETLTPQLIPDPERPLYVRLTGKCPRCEHDMGYQEPIVIVAGVTVLSEESLRTLVDHLVDTGHELDRGDREFEMRCSCGLAHPGHPKDAPHCGSRFTVRVVWP